MGRRAKDLGLAGMGFDLAASVGIGALLGWWIDRRFETGPWATIICSAIGIIGGLLNFVRAGQRAALRAQREAEAERDAGESGE